MRPLAELAIRTVLYTAAINASLLIGEVSKPPQPTTFERVDATPTERVKTEEPKLSELLTEADKLPENPNLFLGRRFTVTLDQKAFAIGAVKQQELKSENGDKLTDYIVQGRDKKGNIKFLFVDVPQNQIGDGPYSWPRPGNPSKPRLYHQGGVIFELEGIQIIIGYQASADRNAQLAVPILVSRGITPPKEEFALSNP